MTVEFYEKMILIALKGFESKIVGYDLYAPCIVVGDTWKKKIDILQPQAKLWKQSFLPAGKCF